MTHALYTSSQYGEHFMKVKVRPGVWKLSGTKNCYVNFERKVHFWPAKIDDKCARRIHSMWWTFVASYFKIHPRTEALKSGHETLICDFWVHGATLNLSRINEPCAQYIVSVWWPFVPSYLKIPTVVEVLQSGNKILLCGLLARGAVPRHHLYKLKHSWECKSDF